MGLEMAHAPALETDGQLVGALDRLLELQPPEVCLPVGIGGRDVDGERQIEALEDRIGIDAVVAIAVVE